MRRLTSVLLLVTAACGDDGHATPVDAAVDVPVDIAIDAPLADAPPPALDHHYFVIDTLRVPTNNNEARMFGLDLNGDGTVDNQLGMVLGTVSAMGIDVQGDTTLQVDRGKMIELLDLYARNFTNEPTATLAAFIGSNPMPAPCASASDTTCRRHLAGTGTFTATAATPPNLPLTGTLANGAMTTAPGHVLAPITLFPSSAGDATYVTLVGAKIAIAMTSDPKIMQLTIAGAVTKADVDSKLMPAMAANAQQLVMKDCTMPQSPPTCGCASSSNGKTMLDLFDGDIAGTQKDCMVSVAEVRGSSLMQSLFAPDVTIDGQMALSIGMRGSAVRAGFVAP